MSGLLKLFVDIALLRRGPQEVPASPVLLAGTVGAYFAVSALVSSVLPPLPGRWFWHLLVDIAFTLAWYVLLLRLFNRGERILQTTTAVFGYQALLAPLWIAAAWMIGRFQNDTTILFFVSLLGVGMLVWILAVNGHILRAALEWPLAGCIGIVLLQLALSQLLLVQLFPPQKPAP